jgi:hypothetical protein
LRPPTYKSYLECVAFEVLTGIIMMMVEKGAKQETSKKDAAFYWIILRYIPGDSSLHLKCIFFSSKNNY